MGACETSSDAMRIDFDSVWKDTTEVYFAALLELFERNRPALPFGWGRNGLDWWL